MYYLNEFYITCGKMDFHLIKLASETVKIYLEFTVIKIFCIRKQNISRNE